MLRGTVTLASLLREKLKMLVEPKSKLASVNLPASTHTATRRDEKSQRFAEDNDNPLLRCGTLLVRMVDGKTGAPLTNVSTTAVNNMPENIIMAPGIVLVSDNENVFVEWLDWLYYGWVANFEIQHKCGRFLYDSQKQLLGILNRGLGFAAPAPPGQHSDNIGPATVERVSYSLHDMRELVQIGLVQVVAAANMQQHAVKNHHHKQDEQICDNQGLQKKKIRFTLKVGQRVAMVVGLKDKKMLEKPKQNTDTNSIWYHQKCRCSRSRRTIE
jgi:hypothetical protein